MRSRHEQRSHVIGIRPQWATTNVRQKATVVSEVHGSGSETDRRVLLLGRCVTSPGFFDARGETLDRVLLIGTTYKRLLTTSSLLR